MIPKAIQYYQEMKNQNIEPHPLLQSIIPYIEQRDVKSATQ